MPLRLRVVPFSEMVQSGHQDDFDPYNHLGLPDIPYCASLKILIPIMPLRLRVLPFSEMVQSGRQDDFDPYNHLSLPDILC